MDLANMQQGVRRLIAFRLNDSCRHQALIEVWSYPANTEIAYFKRRVVCAKCGARTNKIDVRPNWKVAPGTIEDWSGRPAMRVVSNGQQTYLIPIWRTLLLIAIRPRRIRRITLTESRASAGGQYHCDEHNQYQHDRPLHCCLVEKRAPGWTLTPNIVPRNGTVRTPRGNWARN